MLRSRSDKLELKKNYKMAPTSAKIRSAKVKSVPSASSAPKPVRRSTRRPNPKKPKAQARPKQKAKPKAPKAKTSTETKVIKPKVLKVIKPQVPKRPAANRRRSARLLASVDEVVLVSNSSSPVRSVPPTSTSTRSPFPASLLQFPSMSSTGNQGERIHAEETMVASFSQQHSANAPSDILFENEIEAFFVSPCNSPSLLSDHVEEVEEQTFDIEAHEA